MMEGIAPLPTPATQQIDYQGSRKKNTEAKSKPQPDDTARPVNLYIMRRGADVTQQPAVAREEVNISPERPVWHCLCVAMPIWLSAYEFGNNCICKKTRPIWRCLCAAMPICFCVCKQLHLQKDKASDAFRYRDGFDRRSLVQGDEF